MGRGLSKLQRSILEMAYERFLEDAKEEDFYGIRYQVVVGPPSVATNDAPDHWKKYERYYKRHSYLLNGRTLFEAAKEAADKDLERIEATRTEIVQKVSEVAPDLVKRYGPGHSHQGAISNWQWLGDDADGVTRYRFVVGGEYSDHLLNNAPQTRSIVERVKGIGGWYQWWGYGGVYTYEILQKVYGFEPAGRGYFGDRVDVKFDPEQIGEKRYNAARASVSRALKRLEDRMLIDHAYGEATITLEGIAALTGLTVNEVCATHKINRTDDEGKVVIRGVPLPPPPTPEEAENLRENDAVLQGLANIIHPPPPPLAEALFQAIANHIVHAGGTTTKEEVEEAFSEAMQKVEETTKEEATVNENGPEANVNRYEEVTA